MFRTQTGTKGLRQVIIINKHSNLDNQLGWTGRGAVRKTRRKPESWDRNVNGRIRVADVLKKRVKTYLMMYLQFMELNIK